MVEPFRNNNLNMKQSKEKTDFGFSYISLIINYMPIYILCNIAPIFEIYLLGYILPKVAWCHN